MKQFKISSPTVLPAVNLPSFGCNTAIKSSPPSIKSLFDFGFAGPTAGIVVSTILLLAGLQMTIGTTDAATYSYFPALSMELLNFSRLSGSIVDAFLGGALSSSLAADTPFLQLHPFAIAGYSGLVVNALNLLPLGSKFVRTALIYYFPFMCQLFETFFLT